MKVEETKALIEMLRAAGVRHYKTPELELDLGDAPPIVSRETKLEEVLPGAEPEKIPHVVKELTSLLKLSDVDLVDRLFPDHTENDEALAVSGE